LAGFDPKAPVPVVLTGGTSGATTGLQYRRLPAMRPVTAADVARQAALVRTNSESGWQEVGTGRCRWWSPAPKQFPNK